MAKIAYPTADYTAGEFAVGKDVYADIKKLTVEFNGNISADNFADPALISLDFADGAVDSNKLAEKCVIDSKVDLTEANDGALVWTNGPNHLENEGGFICRVRSTFSWDGTSPDVINIYWRDFVDGNPLFINPPVMIGSPVVIAAAAADVLTSCRVLDLSSFKIQIECNYGGGTGEVTMEFCVAGGVTWDL